MLIKAGANVNARTKKLKRTPLHKAGFRGRSLDNDVARPLIAAGAIVNAVDKFGKTPLHIAVETGDLGVVRDLLKAKAQLEARSKDGETALHKAVKNTDFAVIKLLVAAGANVKAKTKLGKGVLSLAEDGMFRYPWSKRVIQKQILPYLRRAGANS